MMSSPPQIASEPFLSQAARGDDGGPGSHFTLGLGTPSGTDAPSDISTLGAWLPRILERLVPPLDWGHGKVTSPHAESSSTHHPLPMSLHTLPSPSSFQLPPRLVLLEAPGHLSFCVHHMVSLVLRRYASEDPQRQPGTEVLLLTSERMHYVALHMTVR